MGLKARQPGERFKTEATPALERMRKLAFALPGVSEGVAPGGARCFAVDDKTLCYYHDTYRSGRPSFWCPGLIDMQEELVNAYPKRFFKPQTSSSGTFSTWLGVFLDGTEVDWTELAMILSDAYRSVASKRRIAELDDYSSGV